MIDHVVTVTCTRDLNQMVLQSHSINLFVNKLITHHVYIEDTATPLNVWADTLQPFYTKHKLKLYYLPLISNHKIGWIRQQAIKLLAVNDVQDDYLILDSKNFFIKDTTLDYTIPDGSYSLLESVPWADDFVEFFLDYTKSERIENYHAQHTPFKIRKEIANKIINTFDVLDILETSMSKDIYPSEFVIYSFATDTVLDRWTWWSEYESKTIYHTWWWNDQLDIDKLDAIYHSTVEILGLHKNVWAVQNEKLEQLAVWLISKGLDPNITQNATYKMVWADTYLRSDADKPLTNKG